MKARDRAASKQAGTRCCWTSGAGALLAAIYCCAFAHAQITPTAPAKLNSNAHDSANSTDPQLDNAKALPAAGALGLAGLALILFGCGLISRRRQADAK